MSEFFAALANPNVPFIRYALFAGLLSSIPFGIIGSFVVVKRMTYIAGAVSHTALGGIGMALYLSTLFGFTLISPLGGAVIFALFSGIIISLATSFSHARIDTIIGATWSIGMSIGMVFIYLTPGYIDPMSYLFGNILLISKANLIMIAALNGFITLCCLVFFNQFVAVSFDKEFAKTRNINILLFESFLILLVSLTVILMISLVGIVMVIALLTLPPAIAGLFAKRMKTLVVVAALLCGCITSLGLVLSYVLELPTGSSTVILAGAIYLVCVLAKFMFKRRPLRLSAV